MTDGTRSSDLNETPQKPEEVKEVVEKQPEVKEAAEAVEKATLKPEEKVEAERDVRESEEIDTALRTAMESSPQQSEEVSATPITLPKEDGGPKPADRVETPEQVDGRRPDSGNKLAEEASSAESPSSGAETVMIDTVPLPEHQSREVEGSSQEAAIDSGGEVAPQAETQAPVEAQADNTRSQRSTETPSKPLMEKELPEGGQMEEELQEQEDLQGIGEGDLSSLLPGEGKVTDPSGKEAQDSKLGGGLGDLPGMDSGAKISNDSEDPSGDQFAGKGTFKPGKGPGHGEVADELEDEADVNAMIEAGASEKELAAKEKQLQEKALDDYELTQATLKTDEAEEEKLKKQHGGSKSEPSSTESTPEEGRDSDVHSVTQAELDAVLEEVGGDQISTQDADDQSGGEPDGRLKPEAAKKIKDALAQAASSKHAQKKAGAELITDPDQEDIGKDGSGGDQGSRTAAGTENAGRGTTGEQASARTAERVELLKKLTPNLPAQSEELTDRTAGELVEMALAENSGDLLSLTQNMVQDHFGALNPQESDAVMCTTLLKASQEAADLAADLDRYSPEQILDSESARTLSESLTDRRYLLGSLLENVNPDQPPDDSGESNPDQGEDDQWANIDLQHMLQKQQQLTQMLSNISKALHDTALAVVRKSG